MTNIFGYIPGDPLMVCDRCGFTKRKSEIRREHTGLLVCPECFDPRHPQDGVRGRREQIAVIDARPEPAENLITAPITANDL